MFDVFANKLFYYGIDTAVIVDLSAVSFQNYEVDSVNFEVSAMNSSVFNEGTTVSFDFFGIN